MGKFFNLDSPFMQLLSKIFDLMLLNILTILFSLPIVTIGAALSGLHYALWHMLDGEGYVFRDFFRGFKDNFLQATALWLFFLLTGIVICVGMLFYIGQPGISMLLAAAGVLMLGFAAAAWLITYPWVFILQSRYENTVKGTLKNALLCGVTRFFPSMLMAALCWLPMVLYWAAPYWFWFLSIVWLLIWFSFSAYLNTARASKIFGKIDRKENV